MLPRKYSVLDIMLSRWYEFRSLIPLNPLKFGAIMLLILYMKEIRLRKLGVPWLVHGGARSQTWVLAL